MKSSILRLVTLAFVIFPSLTFASKKEVALITEKPQQKYIVVSPLSAEGKDLEKIYKKIQSRASDLKADAVIEWKCTQHVSGTTFHNCSGFAVKWVN